MGYFDDIFDPSYLPAETPGLSSIGPSSTTDPYAELSALSALQPQYEKDRGFFGDVFSNLSRGIVQGVGQAGAALDQFGIQNSWDEWAQTADQKYAFLRPDRAEALDQDSWLYSGFKGALQSAPASLIPMGVGIGAGAVAGGGVPGAIAGGIAGMSTLVGLFGAGTYNQTYKSALEQGLDPEAAKKLALETAAWEVGTEGLSDAAAVVTGGLLKAPLKALGQGAKTTLRNMLKMGPADFAKSIGATVSAEVGSEALNAYMQTSAQIKAGLDPEMTPGQAAIAAIGPALWLSGGIALGVQGLNQKRKAQLTTILQSPDASLEAKSKVVDIIETQLKRESPDIAANWRTAADHILQNGGVFNINADFVAQSQKLLETKPTDAVEEATQLSERAPAIIDTELQLGEYQPDLPPGITPMSLEERIDTLYNSYSGPSLPPSFDDATPGPFEQEVSAILQMPSSPTPNRTPTPTAQQRFAEEQSALLGTRTPTATERFAAEQGNVDMTAQQAAEAEMRLAQAGSRQFADQAATAEAEVATRPTPPPAPAAPAVEAVPAPVEAVEAPASVEPAPVEPAPVTPKRALTEAEIEEAKVLVGDYQAILDEEEAGPADPALQMEKRQIEERVGTLAAESTVPLSTIVPGVDRVAISADIQETVTPPEVTRQVEDTVDQAYEAASTQAFSHKFDNFQEAMGAYQARPTVASAQIDEVRSLPIGERKAKADEMLTAALLKDDTAGVKKILTLYEGSSKTPAVANAVFDIVDTIQSEEFVNLVAASQRPDATAADMSLVEQEAKQKLDYIKKTALDVLSETMHRDKGVQVGKLTPDDFMEWTKRGPNFYSSTNPTDGETYFLFRSYNEGPWRIFTSQPETTTYGKGKSKVELTTLQEVPAYVDKEGKPILSKTGTKQSLSQFLQRFYKSSGVKGMKLVPLSEVSTSPDAYSVKGSTKNAYVTAGGQYVVVPTSKGGEWSLMLKSDFDRYKAMTVGEKRAAKIPIKGKSNVSQKEALREAYSRSLQDKADAKAALGEKEEKLTAENEVVSAMRKEASGNTAEEEKGTAWKDLPSVKATAAEKKMILYRVEKNKARTDAQNQDILFKFVSQLGKAINKGDTGWLATIYSQMTEAFGTKNLKKPAEKRAVKRDIESIIMVSFGDQISAIQQEQGQIDAQIQETLDRATSKELKGEEYSGLKKDIAKLQKDREALGMRIETLVTTARRYNKGLPKDLDAATQVLTSLTLNDIPMLSTSKMMTASVPIAVRRQLKAEEKALKEELAKSLLVNEVETTSKKATLSKEEVEQRLQEIAERKAAKISTRKAQIAAEQEIAAKRGPLFKTKGSPNWQSSNGYELRKEGSKWIAYDRNGIQIGQSYASIAAAAKDSVFAAPATRAPETYVSEEEAAAWRSAQDAKIMEERLLTEAEILATPAMNGWEAPVKSPGENGRITMQTKSGRLQAEYVVRTGTFSTSASWQVTDTRNGQPIGRFISASRVMEVIPGTLSSKNAKDRAIKEAQIGETTFNVRFATQNDTVGVTNNTVRRVEESLRNALGYTAKRWQNRVRIVQSLTEASGIGQEIRSRGVTGRVLGFYSPKGTITLVADQIERGAEVDVFYHEAMHHVLESDPIYTSKRNNLLKEFASRKSTSDAIGAAFNRAKAENPGLDINHPDMMKEAYSYFMQDSANRSISLWRKFTALVRSWAIRARLPFSKAGMDELSFASLAAHSIKTAPSVYVLPQETDTTEALHRDHAEAAAKAVDQFLEKPGMKEKFSKSVVVTRSGADGERKPLVLYRPTKTLTEAAPAGMLLGGKAPVESIIDEYGASFTPESGLRSLPDDTKETSGTFFGYTLSASSPVYVTQAEFERISQNKESLASRVVQWKEMGGPNGTGADVVLIMDSKPQIKNGRVVPGSRGAVKGVFLLDPAAAHPIDASYTFDAVSRIRFSSETTNPNPVNKYERTTPTSALLPLGAQSPSRNSARTARRPSTETTPKNEKGKLRSDYLLYDDEKGTITYYANYSTEAKDYTDIRVVDKAEARKIEEQFAAERRERDMEHFRNIGVKEAATEKASDTFSKAKSLTKNLLQSISERVKGISSPVYSRLSRYEFDLHRRSKAYEEASREWAQGYMSMSAEDQHLLDQALRNGDTISRDLILEQNGATESFKSVSDMLEQITAEAAEYGLVPKKISNYFPRMVQGNKLDQLRQALEKTDPETYTVIGNELRLAEEVAGKPLGIADRQAIISKILNSGQYQFIPRPGSSKYRAYEKVKPEHAQYYANSAQALTHYLYEMANAIETRRFLGKKNSSRPRTMNSLLSRISEIEKIQSQTQPLSQVEAERLRTLIDEAESYADKLEDINSDLEESISAFIEEEIRAGNIKDDPKTGTNRSHELVQLLRSRLTQKGTHGIVGTMRDVGYMFALGSPMSAITQLGDLSWSAYENGIGNTAAAVFKSLPALFRGDKAMTKEYFDFSNSITDFSTNASQAVLDKILTATGLKSMDLFGKEVFLQASYRKAKKISKAKFVEQWTPLLGDAKMAKEVKAKIDAGQVGDPDVLFVLFNNLSQYQPIALSELPAAYNTAGNLRVFYMLKTFNIKALNTLHREFVSDYKAGNKLVAARKFAYLATLLSLSGAGSDEIKNWILGREEPFSDMVMDNFIQLSLMNRYAMEKGFNSGRIISSVAEGFLPPLRFADYAMDDIGKFAFDRENFKFKSLNNIPVAGRWYYSRTEAGRETELANRKKRLYDEIKASAAAGQPLYSKTVRELVESYNTLAGDLGEEKVAYKQLRNVRKKELKRLRTEA